MAGTLLNIVFSTFILHTAYTLKSSFSSVFTLQLTLPCGATYHLAPTLHNLFYALCLMLGASTLQNPPSAIFTLHVAST